MDFTLLFDRQYLDEGLVCIQSILDNCKSSRIFVLCLEPYIEETVKNIERTTIISLKSLEQKYPEIAITKKTKPWAPYTQSLKPFLPEYIFDNFNINTLTYVDSDMMFWNDCYELDQEFDGYSFMVTFRGQNPPAISGYFNGGFFSCRNDKDCRIFLKWWQEKCVEWCLWCPGTDGKFGEEGYLNIIWNEPNKFNGVKICKHPGANLAPWNIHQHNIKIENNIIIVDNNYLLVCYHYQGFKAKSLEFKQPERISEINSEILYRPYYNKFPIKEKLKCEKKINSLLDTFIISEGPIVLQKSSYNSIPVEFIEKVKSNPKLCHYIKERILYISILCENVLIGFMIPNQNDNIFDLMIFIDEKYRNKGYGKKALNMYMYNKQGLIIIENNDEISKKLFLASGFKKSSSSFFYDKVLDIYTK